MVDYYDRVCNLAGNLCWPSFAYFLVYTLKEQGYHDLPHTNALMIVANLSHIHVIGLICLQVALFDHNFYKIFLALNFIWLGLITFHLVYFITRTEYVDGWTGNPMNHIILIWYYISALMLHFAVYKHMKYMSARN